MKKPLLFYTSSFTRSTTLLSAVTFLYSCSGLDPKHTKTQKTLFTLSILLPQIVPPLMMSHSGILSQLSTPLFWWRGPSWSCNQPLLTSPNYSQTSISLSVSPMLSCALSMSPDRVWCVFLCWVQVRTLTSLPHQNWVRSYRQCALFLFFIVSCDKFMTFGNRSSGHPTLHVVRATLPPSILFADRVLLHRGYSISDPNTWGETVSKSLGLTLGLVYNPSRLQLTRQSLHSITKREWHGWRCWP